MKHTFWLGILASLVFVVACSDDKTKKTQKDAGSDGSTEEEPDTSTHDPDSETEKDPDAGQTVDSGSDPSDNCVPGTLDCICGPGNSCEEGVCAGTHCHLVAVWGLWNGADPEKEVLWWNDQGVWQ